MTALLVWIIGGTRRNEERRVACPCGWWAEVDGEIVEGHEEWFPNVTEVVCEECGSRIDTREG